ncbi:MAG: rhodanese-like domain-containing protein [Steroidobacteraceae bacterium]
MRFPVARRALAVLVLTATMSAGIAAAEPAAPAGKVPVLNRAQVDALLATPEKIVVIDLRRPDEQASKGAFPVFLSIQADDLEKYLAYIPRDRQVLAVSNHSRRSGQAAELLAKHGFKVAGVVGAQIYEEEGGKLNKVVPPAAKH